MLPSKRIEEVAKEYANENRSVWDSIEGKEITPSTHDYLFAIMEYLDEEYKALQNMLKHSKD